jgi:cell division septum initiation protein DivIVA
MSDALPDPPTLEPGSLAGASFSRSRRGFEPTEVRSLLGRVADALRVWAVRDEQLRHEVASLRERVESAEHLDEAKVTELLGAETARIVAAARSAAAEIREHAEADAAALTERTEAEVSARRDQLLSDAAAEREAAAAALAAAESEASSTKEAAARDAEELRRRSQEEADALLDDATRTAEERTAAAEASATQTLEDARSRHDELIAEATGVLDARTSEAEEAASQIRQTAEAELRAARQDAERLRQEADATADATREEAREDARAMLEETRGLRHRMLRDLAERRRVARQQIEAARVARHGVVEAIRSAAGRLEDAVVELDEADAAAQRAADAAAAAVPDDVLTVAVQLEAELDGAEPELQGGPSSAGELASEAPPASEATSSEVPGTVEEISGEPGSAPAPSPAEEGSQETEGSAAGSTAGDDVEREVPEVAAEHVDTVDAPEGAREDAAAGSGDSAGVEPSGGARQGEQLASVHDLFERLRSGAEEAEDGEEAEDDEATSETPNTGAHPSAGAQQRAAVAEPTLASVAAVAVVEDAAEVSTAGEDTMLLDRRDEVLAPAERLLARTLKRLVGDEQNEVLDRARRIRKGRVELVDLLPDDIAERYVQALAEPYRLAAAAGAQMWCEATGDPLPTIDDDGVGASLRARVVELEELRRVQLRTTLEQLDESGEDLAVLVDHLRAAYRELRSSSVPHQAADLAIAGFTAGTAAAAPTGVRWRWVPDNAGLPCADAEDNALAGPLPCGEAFPTGDVLPPAHPGCRCIVVPAGSDG